MIPQPQRSRQGFGLMEVLASIFIMALMFSALNMLQKSNYDTAVRLQSRDEAMQIAQNHMSELEALGVNAVTADTDTVYGSSYSLPGGVLTRRMFVREMRVTENMEHDSIAGELVASNVVSKNVDMSVRWKQGMRWYSINMTTVVQ